MNHSLEMVQWIDQTARQPVWIVSRVRVIQLGRFTHAFTHLFEAVSQSANVIGNFGKDKKSILKFYTIYLKANLQVHLFDFPAMKIHLDQHAHVRAEKTLLQVGYINDTMFVYILHLDRACWHSNCCHNIMRFKYFI